MCDVSNILTGADKLVLPVASSVTKAALVSCRETVAAERVTVADTSLPARSSN